VLAFRSPTSSRTVRFAALLAGLCALCACASRTRTSIPGAPLARPVTSAPLFADEHPELTLRDLRLFGSHNSYHRTPRFSFSHWFEYDHPGITQQLDRGLRQFELDVRYEHGTVRVAHVPLLDGRSSCKKLDDCVRAMKRWSKVHPGHLPIVVFIETKEDIIRSDFTGRLDAIDSVIRHIVPKKQLLVPDDVSSGFTSLHDATVARGLATLSEARGKLMFVFFGTERHVRSYAGDDPLLRGKLMFAASRNFDAPYASIVNVDRAEQSAKMEAALARGLLVRTRADRGLDRDRGLRQKALGSGAHFVSSDFIGALDGWLGVDPLAPGACNPLASAPSCRSARVSELSRSRWTALTRPLEQLAWR
jgi:Phosphoinositide phospholipase C, Ca2+-dependent